MLACDWCSQKRFFIEKNAKFKTYPKRSTPIPTSTHAPLWPTSQQVPSVAEPINIYYKRLGQLTWPYCLCLQCYIGSVNSLLQASHSGQVCNSVAERLHIYYTKRLFIDLVLLPLLTVLHMSIFQNTTNYKQAISSTVVMSYVLFCPC